MRDVAIVATAQAPSSVGTTLTVPELMIPIFADLFGTVEDRGVKHADIDFWCHGSCDYLSGQSFSFVNAVDAIGAWPPIVESHVEADGAFALHEAWVKIQTGEADTAVVFGNGKNSTSPIEQVMALQMDPYSEAPLFPGLTAVAALQSRACLEAGVFTEREMAEVVVRSRRDAIGNPLAVVRGEHDVEELLAEPMSADPLRAHDCPPVTDGANAVILAADDTACRWSDRPAWIRGVDHRIDPQRLGARSLIESASAAAAAVKAGLGSIGPLDIAELHAPFSHQELILRRSMGISGNVVINPSGGALCANPWMAAGLARIIEVADRIHTGAADRGLAHCTSGPALQQNLVVILEGA